ncbi:hypothetical protein K7432_006788 [Basidiobolus ranarum]|uniref:Peptidase S8/S53 domain-containing protein n=1 Tax=Basidiobolus ranarum TaxID=34480 RepID=A0ABR2W146_9FUNG
MNISYFLLLWLIGIVTPHVIKYAIEDFGLAQRKLHQAVGTIHGQHINIANRFLGFVGNLSSEHLAILRNSPWIAYVEPEGRFKLNGFEDDQNLIVQPDPPNWGLSRISCRARNLDLPYVYNTAAGKGVDVYVLDSGVNVAHQDFQGRAKFGANFANEIDDDLRGHGDAFNHICSLIYSLIDGDYAGTHVAGIIAGSAFGVAKKANIISVKVISTKAHTGTSTIIQGLEWAVKASLERENNPLINMSFNGKRSQALNDVIAAITASNIPVIVSAGNRRTDACKFSPASSEWALTVGATDKRDRKAPFSNFGSCVDIFAPGRRIRSDSIGSLTATMIKSGTR